MNMFRSQLRQELVVMARNGEQLLLLIGIPILLLIFSLRLMSYRLKVYLPSHFLFPEFWLSP